MPHAPPPWELPDEQLLRQCRVEAFRGSGPGGQKRNKTSSAIRITHTPTGTQGVAAEDRSQSVNRLYALRRLRLKMALENRREVDPLEWRPPEWMNEYLRAGFHINPSNPRYPAFVAILLDVLKAVHWEPVRAAVLFGVSTGAFLRFLHGEPAAWTKTNQIRAELGMKPLTKRD